MFNTAGSKTLQSFTPIREIVPFIYKKGGKVSIINKSTVKKKKMKQKQTQKQIVNIYNTKPTARKRVYKKVEKKKEEPQRMPVYYTQPSYTQYLPAPTITMPTRLPQALERSSVLPTMTPETKLPTPLGQTTGLKTSKETGTDPEFDADFNDYMNEKQIYEQEQEEIKRKNKELVDFLINGNNYQDEELPNFNFGRERLPPPPPPKPPQQEFKDPSEFSEYPEEDDDYQEPSSQPSLISDVPANKTYSKWTLSQLQQETINRGLYTITNEPKQGQSRNAYGNRDKTRKELISGLHEYDRIKLNKNN